MNLISKIKEKKKNKILCAKNYKLRYITGLSALNIPYKEMQCDWHRAETLKSAMKNGFIMHPNSLTGAEEIFGTYGIWDCAQWLKSKGFKGINYLCATPIRAVLDMLYDSIAVRGRYPLQLEHFWDYMFDELDINELNLKLKEFEKVLNLEQKEIFNKWKSDNDI